MFKNFKSKSYQLISSYTAIYPPKHFSISVQLKKKKEKNQLTNENISDQKPSTCLNTISLSKQSESKT